MQSALLPLCVFFLLWTPGLAQSKLDPYWRSYDAVEEPVTGDLILIDATAIYRVAGERMSRVAGGPPFSLLVSVSVEFATGDIIVLDAAQAALFRVRGGQVTEIFSGEPLVRPVALDLNPATGAFVVLDRGSRAVYEIGESGAVTVVSDRLDSAHPVDLVVDQATGDYLLLDEEVGLFRFGSDGSWTCLSKLPSMGRATRLKQDSATGNLLVIGSEPRELLRLDFRGEVLPSRREFALEGGQSPISFSHEEPGVGSLMDVDGNGTDDALTDGLLVLRRLFGFTGTTLTDGAIGPSAVRSTPDEVINYTDEVLHNIRIEPDPISPNIIAGATDNWVTDGVWGATISGGGDNDNAVADRNNRVTDRYGTVGGGLDNQAGDYNAGNLADAQYATVGGGLSNTASGSGATVGGGRDNWASGIYSTILGGSYNHAGGRNSLAAGTHAKANHKNSFVWNDSTSTDFISSGPRQFLIRAEGGVGINLTQPLTQFHVTDAKSGTATLPNHVAAFENTGGSSADVLALTVAQSSPTAAQNFITMFGGGGTASDIVGQLEGNGSGGVQLSSGAADYAEWLPKLRPEEEIEEGEIVGNFGGRVSKQTDGADLVQVVSANSIVLGNTPAQVMREHWEKVAFLGQVTVRVRGKVQAGDWIVPSGNGDGMGKAIAPESLKFADLKSVVGQAWESSDGESRKTIKVAVGLNLMVRPLASQLEEQLRRLDRLEQQIDELLAKSGSLTRR